MRIPVQVAASHHWRPLIEGDVFQSCFIVAKSAEIARSANGVIRLYIFH